MSENDGTLCILLKGVILTYGFFYGPHLLLEKLGCLCPRLSSRKGSATDSKEETLSKETIACAHAESLKLYHAFKNCEDKYIVDKLRSAMKIMSDALRLYGPEQLFSSYNGGKDADVTMYLLRAVIAKYSDERNTIYRPKVIYFAVNDEFPEVLQHIRESQRNFALDLVTCSGNIVQGIAQHIEGMKASNLNAPAFMLGTRRGDPNSADQQAFSPSSEWMPAFMRVNPILDWDYSHVWHFLRLFQLPYCSLYDVGYTSLGKQSDTRPNPALWRSNGSESESKSFSDNTHGFYLPAYMLTDSSLERAGRGADKRSGSKQ